MERARLQFAHIRERGIGVCLGRRDNKTRVILGQVTLRQHAVEVKRQYDRRDEDREHHHLITKGNPECEGVGPNDEAKRALK